jgi:hypothetical protein
VKKLRLTYLAASILIVLVAAAATGCQEKAPTSYLWTKDQAVSEFERWAKARSGMVSGYPDKHYQCYDYLTRAFVVSTHRNKEATGTAIFSEPWPKKDGFGRWQISTVGREGAGFRILEKSGEVELLRGGKGVKEACQLS